MNPLNTPTPAAVEPDLFITLLKTAGMLGLVLGVLIAVLYLIKRYSIHGTGRSDKNPIQMLASYHLTPKEKIVLLDVLGEKILVGVTSQTINTLAILNSEGLTEIRENIPLEKGFSKLLKTAIKKGKKDKDAYDAGL